MRIIVFNKTNLKSAKKNLAPFEEVRLLPQGISLNTFLNENKRYSSFLFVLHSHAAVTKFLQKVLSFAYSAVTHYKSLLHSIFFVPFPGVYVTVCNMGGLR